MLKKFNNLTFVLEDENGLCVIYEAASALTATEISTLADAFENDGLGVTEIQHGESQETFIFP